MQKLVTIPEVAERVLGVKVHRAYEMARLGILPAGVVVRFGRQVRIDQQALSEWVRNGGQALPGGWRRRQAE